MTVPPSSAAPSEPAAPRGTTATANATELTTTTARARRPGARAMATTTTTRTATNATERAVGCRTSGVSATSRTSTTTVIGRHEHVISGYSLLKGIGDGEPIASDRFMVGGHEWVLLFYPDGKRSMSDGNAPNQPQDDPYAALFVALIGEGQRPLGVVQSGQGRVVRAFHRFTLVDQSGNGRHITKGRQREQGAVKISCARQDPQARNCHGYRKFVRRSVLEASGSGYLVDDVVVIRYEIELVVTSGGALNKSAKLLPAASVNVPTYPTIGKHLVKLLYDPEGNFDCAFQVEGEKFNAHKLVLASRSSVFAAMLRTGAEMREGREGVCTLLDIKPEVFRLLLHFVYADEIPPGGRAVGALAAAEGDASISGGGADEPGAAEPRARPGCASDEIDLDVPMTQHLLVAADRFDLSRLRAMCEARLCESVDVDTVANTLMLAELNHANALKKSCMSFIAVNLSDVMETEGYDDMIASCPHLASEILSSVAEMRATKQHQPVGGALDANAAGVNVHANPGVSAAAVATAAARDLDVNQGGVLALPSNVGTDLTSNAATIPTMSAFSNFLASRVQRLAHSPPTPLDGVAAVGTRAAIDAEDAAAIATAQAAAAPPPSGVVTPPRPPAAETRRDADAADAGRRVRPRR